MRKSLSTPNNCSKQNIPLSLASALTALVIASNVHAAGATSVATATSISPIAVAASQVLSFGRFVPAVGATTLTISNSGVRTGTGAIILSNTQAAYSAARFDVSGEANATYSITHSGAAVLTAVAPAAGATMALTKTSDFSASNATTTNVAAGTLGATGLQSIYVGGTIAVAASQAPGTYTGDVTITVEYN